MHRLLPISFISSSLLHDDAANTSIHKREPEVENEHKVSDADIIFDDEQADDVLDHSVYQAEKHEVILSFGHNSGVDDEAVYELQDVWQHGQAGVDARLFWLHIIELHHHVSKQIGPHD